MLKLVVCSTGRIQAVSWCSSSVAPGSWHLHWLIQISSSPKLLFQTGEIFPKGEGGCAVRISVVFLTPVLQCLWKQGPESKGWSWIMRGWEPYEAPSDCCMYVLIGIQSRSLHTRSANTPRAPSSGSPYHLCQCASSNFIPGLHAEFCPCCPTASLTSQELDLPFHGHRDPLFLQRTRLVSCHPKPQNLGNKY